MHSPGLPRESIHQLRVSPPQGLEEELELRLGELAPWGWEEDTDSGGRTVVRIHCQTREQAEGLDERLRRRVPGIETRIREQESRDWATSWKEFFQPCSVAGKYLVLPPWEEPDPGNGLIPVFIDPQMAFGTGHHPTTCLCLQAVADLWNAGLINPKSRFLDLGTGSGILAIACCLTGMRGVGLDNDPVAVRCAEENSRLNGVRDNLSIFCGTQASLRPGQRFDLILANILARPLRAMAPELAKLLAPRGHLVLSGILNGQEGEVMDAYGEAGLGGPGVMRDNGWSAILWGAGAAIWAGA